MYRLKWLHAAWLLWLGIRAKTSFVCGVVKTLNPCNIWVFIIQSLHTSGKWGEKKNATWVTIETKPWPFKNCHGQSWWCAMSEKHNSGHWEANSVRGWMNEEVYPRTLEHRGGPGSTCDDIWHQAFVDALHKRDGGWLGQRVVWIGPRGRGRRPRLFSGHHLIYPVQRDWRQQLTYKQLTSLRAPGAAHSCRNRLIQMYKMDGSFRPCSDLRVA